MLKPAAIKNTSDAFGVPFVLSVESEGDLDDFMCMAADRLGL